MEYPNDPYDGIEPRSLDRQAHDTDRGSRITEQILNARPGEYLEIGEGDLKMLIAEAQDVNIFENDFGLLNEMGETHDVDMVNHPPHYTKGGIETIDYMKAKSTPEEFKGHLRLTTIKYLSRAGDKDDILQEYEKAFWYLSTLIKTIKQERGMDV